MRLIKTSRQAQRGEATHRRILEAAAAVFARHGPTAPIDAVCRTAGCSKGAFYHHFRDRAQLNAALAWHFAARLTQGDLAPAAGLLLGHLWGEGYRRPQVRRPLVAAMRALAISIEWGTSLPQDAEGGQGPGARLGRLLVLGRLAQWQLWAPAPAGDEGHQEALFGGPEEREKVGLASSR